MLRASSLSKWKSYKPDTQEGSLFFAQRFCELFFDYTLIAFNSPALCGTLLCREAIELIELFEETKHDNFKYEIELIVEELLWWLTNDSVAKNLLDGKKELYATALTNLNDLHNLKITLELISLKLSFSKYITENKVQLIEAVKRKGEKENIDNLCKSLAMALQNFGYHKSDLYHKTLKFLTKNNHKFTADGNSLEEFLASFDLKVNKYEVVFRGDLSFQDLKDSCSKFDVEILDVFEARFNQEAENSFITDKDKSEIFIRCKNIEAYGMQSAREIAENKVNTIAKRFVFFRHRGFPYITKDALVYRLSPSNERVILFSETASSMEKTVDLNPEKAVEELHKILSSFKLQKNSQDRFDRAMDLHGVAIETKIIENQILNIWIALETVVATKTSQSKINQMITSLTPFLVYNLLKSIFDDVTNALIDWNHSKLEGILKKLPTDIGSRDMEKVAALIMIKDYEALLEKLFKEMDNFPLLRFRMYQLNKNLNNGKKIIQFLDNFETKVKWDIRRLYRTRNSIVHVGNLANEAEFLLGNAHNFLDTFLYQILELVMEGNHIETIEQGIKEMALIGLKYKNFLQVNEPEVCTKDNYKMLLFGRG